MKYWNRKDVKRAFNSLDDGHMENLADEGMRHAEEK